MRDLWKPLLAILVCCAGVTGLLSGRPIERASGVLVEQQPLQVSIDAPTFSHREFDLRPRARYDITARVLSVEPYKMDDGARLSPLDFALGWGPMSDTAVLEHFRITQGARFFTLYPDEQAIDLGIALLGSANMHLIPATAQIGTQLGAVRAGNIVRLQGMLVDASGPNGYTWNTSLTRTDTGAGACELLFVESVEVR